MQRLAGLMVMAMTLLSLAGCSSCQKWLGHGPTGAPCAPQPYPAMAPAYPAPYAAGAPIVTDPNMIMPSPH
jgi:hypothetical protein